MPEAMSALFWWSAPITSTSVPGWAAMKSCAAICAATSEPVPVQSENSADMSVRTPSLIRTGSARARRARKAAESGSSRVWRRCMSVLPSRRTFDTDQLAIQAAIFAVRGPIPCTYQRDTSPSAGQVSLRSGDDHTQLRGARPLVGEIRFHHGNDTLFIAQLW